MPYKCVRIDRIGDNFSHFRLTTPSRIASMQSSLAVSGQLQPVVIRPQGEGYQLLDGFKRYYAARALQWDSLECRVVDADDITAKAMLLTCNYHSGGPEAYEQAGIVYSLRKSYRQYVAITPLNLRAGRHRLLPEEGAPAGRVPDRPSAEQEHLLGEPAVVVCRASGRVCRHPPPPGAHHLHPCPRVVPFAARQTRRVFKVDRRPWPGQPADRLVGGQVPPGKDRRPAGVPAFPSHRDP